MSDSSQSYHEPTGALRDETMDMHRALVSLQEELEAVDWYRQRSDACSNEELRAILTHNMREEIEHASMLLEWLRRHDTDFKEKLHTYLFAKDDILEAEAQTQTTQAHAPHPGAEPPDGPVTIESHVPIRLTVGSLKEAK